MPISAVNPPSASSRPSSQAGGAPSKASVSHTWNGARPAFAANPATSSTCAAARAAPPGTPANAARLSEPARVASSSSPASSAAPLTFPNDSVTRAPDGRPSRWRSKPARSQKPPVISSQPNRNVNASLAVSTTATASRVSAYPAPSPPAGRPAAERQRGRHRHPERDHEEQPGEPVRRKSGARRTGAGKDPPKRPGSRPAQRGDRQPGGEPGRLPRQGEAAGGCQDGRGRSSGEVRQPSRPRRAAAPAGDAPGPLPGCPLPRQPASSQQVRGARGDEQGEPGTKDPPAPGHCAIPPARSPEPYPEPPGRRPIASSRACRIANGGGGEPGSHTSTSMTEPMPPEVAYESARSPPPQASVPTAITTFGSGIPSQVRRSGSAMPCAPAPVTSRTSAWRGLAVKKIPSRWTS